MQQTSEQLEKHKKVVSFLRWFFLGFSGFITLIIFIWPQVVRQRDFLKSFMKSAGMEYTSISNMNMTKVSFLSQDSKGQPFVLEAQKVSEIDPDKKLIQLDEPTGIFHLQSGKDVTFTSPQAYYYQNDDLVHFFRDVLVKSSDGYTGNLSDVRLNYKKQTAESHRPIDVAGPELTLKAQAFKSRQNGDEIDFFGDCFLKLTSQKDVVEITSKGEMQLRQTPRTFTAVKDVVIVHEKNKIYSDEAVAFYEKDTQGQFVLKALDVEGNVRIKTPTETVTGQKAVYDAGRQEMVISKDVEIARPSGTIRGQKAIVNMNTGISRMSASMDESGKKSGRIKGIFLPSEKKKDKMPKESED